MKASLHTARLHYGNGVVLHTASSGSVAELHSLYLRLDDGEHVAVGEVRINIAYLNGYSAEEVLQAALAAVQAIDWERSPEVLLASMSAWAAPWSMPVRCLIDCALHDMVSRRAAQPLAVWLGQGAAAPLRWHSNQTLFWSPFEVFMGQAEAYVARGFRDLKVRVAAGDFAEDLRRLGALRDRFGDTVHLAADANAQWSADEAPARLAALAPFGLEYLEQPIATTRPADMAALADRSPMPLMLDEGMGTQADVDGLCALGHERLWAHLKLVKLGGIAPTVAAARRLQAAGVACMVGQMNEGAAATAAALHTSRAVAPRFAELYGADGLADDPVSGISYGQGDLAAAGATGLGTELDISLTQHLWSS
ncbi:mandelate racemase [Xylophilus rhododendri]|uniref:Mandelate racemase n=1 Tax=Xylophilus rhododendri TaxID=2697032 RepID=A0A857J8C2_9BURK|nr:mandelate racemase/muconate lactonizing enzyme family protein [Xylophilus rhododendri]QHI99463.1 mandelate racemase [Xylophilus rhododendri]